MVPVAELVALAQVVMIDLVLAGDNAVVVGMAVAGLPREQRARAMVIGIAAATLMRIGFASITVQLLQIIGLLLAGGLLLLWVSWKLWRELQEQRRQRKTAGEPNDGLAEAAGEANIEGRKTMRQATTQIIIADVSMSLDNVLAVAGAARDHGWVLVVGLALSVAFMGLAAVVIARLLARHHWIAYVGLALILYVALRMIFDGTVEVLEATNGAML
ncbi:MAG: YjbE family putative metal transport protein [Gammaproteobacteria bacterium]|nr:YjbE family putative metal transport protein [Gammaproteobacteria bacterium]